MFEELERSIKSQNYDIAQNIINELQSQNADQLWLRYYKTLIVEQQNRLEEAEQNYRQIIKDSVYPDPKLINLIRNAIERIVTEKKQLKAEKKAVFTEVENSQDLAVLVLTEVSLEQKQKFAPQFAKIMEIDRYTATLQIPTRSWRLYKTGNLGELNYYQAELAKIGVPDFCYPLKRINSMEVYQVESIALHGQFIVFTYGDQQEQKQQIKIPTQEIITMVKGMMPLFELTVNLSSQYKVTKKESTLDYVAFLDLHSPINNKIFRFNDRSYQFNQDQNILENTTTKAKWLQLEKNLTTQIQSLQVFNNFKLFAEGATQFPEMLNQIKSHVNLYRRDDSVWDEAWQLYSGLIFLESQ